MVEISIIKSSELMFHDRLDPDFYKPSYLEIYHILEKISNKYPLVKLPKLLIIPVRTGSTPDPENRIPKLDGSDVMFIKTDSVRKGFINYDSADLLPLIEHKKRESTALKKMDIVVTVVGATHEIIGRAGIFLRNCEANINQSNAIIRVDFNKIEPGYLSTFINSRYGRTQLWRYSGQTGQVTMNCREVEELLVLMLPKKLRKEIHRLIIESEIMREKSIEIYKKAEDLLNKELNIKNIKIEKKLVFTKNLSEINNNKRIDAEYYKPEYEDFLDIIYKHHGGFINLSENDIKDEIFVPKNQEKYNYIELANIKSSIGLVESTIYEIGENLPTRARKLVKDSDVIISTIEGSLNSSALITKEYDNSLCSTGFFVLNLKNIYCPEFLVVLVKNWLIQALLKRGCSGTILAAISKKELMKIPLPKVNKKNQKKIVQLIKESYSYYYKAKNNLEKAKKKVEKAIEENKK